MEQWILDGRRIIANRDPKDIGLIVPVAHAAAALRHETCVPGADTALLQRSMLLHDKHCRLVECSKCSVSAGEEEQGSAQEPKLEFNFNLPYTPSSTATVDCGAGDESATAKTPLGFATAHDVSGIFGVLKAHLPAISTHGSSATAVSQTDATAAEASTPSVEKPKPYAECIVDARWYFNGELTDKIDGMDFVCGAGIVPQALEESVLHMHAGETAAFLSDPAFAFREDGLHVRSERFNGAPPIPGLAVVSLVVTLLSFENPMTGAQRLARAAELKAEGNAKFQEENWQAALKTYRTALDKLSFTSAGAAAAADAAEQSNHPSEEAKAVESKEEKARIQAETMKLKAVLLHNCAFALMNDGAGGPRASAAQAVVLCARSITADPTNAKAWYRKALALMITEKFDEARQDVAKMREKNLGDAHAVAELSAKIDRAERTSRFG